MKIATDNSQAILQCFLEGEDHRIAGRLSDALAAFESCWLLLPEPQYDEDASTWILSSLGDLQFQLGDFESSFQSFRKVMACPEALGNPFIHLRLGQSALETGRFEDGCDDLNEAYLTEPEVFCNEDPKYLALVMEARVQVKL
jgi:tetratricopeptide (TPR) repeat protein